MWSKWVPKLSSIIGLKFKFLEKEGWQASVVFIYLVFVLP